MKLSSASNRSAWGRMSSRACLITTVIKFYMCFCTYCIVKGKLNVKNKKFKVKNSRFAGQQLRTLRNVHPPANRSHHHPPCGETFNILLLCIQHSSAVHSCQKWRELFLHPLVTCLSSSNNALKTKRCFWLVLPLWRVPRS